MINITDKKDCVGCNACTQRCPRQCISMHEDKQGFLYPKVDLNLCIHCDLCEKVCPVINQMAPREPLETFAANNTDDKVRMTSSSGGIFFALAKNIIEEGGVVFGAKFNSNWEVVHDYAETLEGVRAFQGSKYVQSKIGETFLQAEKFLKAGRKVMFTGTPCQIAALGLFLRKDYGSQLLKVDVVCHGVPSPGVWREYLMNITRPKGTSDGKNTVFSSLKEAPVITGISFRDKRLGWEKFGFSVRVAASQASGKNSVFQSVNVKSEEQELLFETLDENIFIKGFLKNLYLRPSCYACPTKQLKSGSDISIADFWGIEKIHPDLNDNRGLSLTLINTYNGSTLFNNSKISKKSVKYDIALVENPAIVRSPKQPNLYERFWMLYPSMKIKAIQKVVLAMTPSINKRIINKIYRVLSGFYKNLI